MILGLLFKEGYSHQELVWRTHGGETIISLKSRRARTKKIQHALATILGSRYRHLKVVQGGRNELYIYCGEILTHKLAILRLKGRKEVRVIPSRVGKKKPSTKGVKVAIVIDDIGYNLHIARELLNLPVPITLSIFPYAPHAREIAREAQEKKHVILMHLPMEPEGYPEKGKDPGPGALYVKMSVEEIKKQLETDLNRIPWVCGINNHMGSRFTCDMKGMRAVMEVLKERGKIFLDSRTIAGTVGYKLAKKFGVPTASRDIFLDNVRDVKKIKKQLDHLVAIAKRKGSAIGIGHPHRATVIVLKKLIPEYMRSGITFVYINALTR